jgi:hypothetical protein
LCRLFIAVGAPPAIVLELVERREFAGGVQYLRYCAI